MFDDERYSNIKLQIETLNAKCLKRELEIAALAHTDREQYVAEMVELVDYESKEFSRLISTLRELIREERNNVRTT